MLLMIGICGVLNLSFVRVFVNLLVVGFINV